MDFDWFYLWWILIYTWGRFNDVRLEIFHDSWFEGMIYSSILKGHKQAHVCFWILYSEVDPCISICPVFALHGGVKFLLYPICCQDLLDIQIMLVPHDGLFILKSKPSNPFVVQDDSGTEKSSQTIWQGSIEGPPRKTRRGRNPPGFPGVLWDLYFGHPMIWMLQFQKWRRLCKPSQNSFSLQRHSTIVPIYFLHFYWWSIIIYNFGVMFLGWFLGFEVLTKLPWTKDSCRNQIHAGFRGFFDFLYVPLQWNQAWDPSGLEVWKEVYTTRILNQSKYYMIVHIIYNIYVYI